jgi:hypothetical protein
VRLIAVEGQAGRYRLPANAVMAFRGADGRIILVEDIRLRLLQFAAKPGNDASAPREHVELSLCLF